MSHFLTHRHPGLLLGAVLLAIAAWLGLGLLHERERIERDEFARLHTEARVIEDNLARSLTTIELSLVSIQTALPSWQDRASGQSDALQMLSGMESAMTSVRTFLVTDAQGTITFSNRKELLGRNFFQRDYVQAPLKARNPALLYVSPPFKSVLNNYLINLSRVQLDAQGRFAGVISAAVDPVDFEILINSVRYSPDMQAALVHANGQTFIAQPLGQDAPDKTQPSYASRVAQHLQNGQAVSQSVTMGPQPQLQVIHTVLPKNLALDKPLVVVLSRPRTELLQAWQHDVAAQLLGFVLLAVASALAWRAFERQRTQKIMTAKRLKLATEASGVGIWEFDLVTRCYQWDDVMFTLFGLHPQSTSPRNDDWIKLLPAQDLQRMHDATRATIRQGQPFNMTFQITRPDGQVRYMRNRAALYSDDLGVPRRLIGATEDVTQRQQQEAELRVAAAAFESHESMLVTNAQVKILRVNQAFSALFGYDATEVMGQNLRLLKSGRHAADFYTAMWRTLLQQHSWQGEVWNTRKNGQEFPCWLCITAVTDEAGDITHYVATHTDITLRKAAEDEVKRLAFFDPLTQLPNRRLLTDRLHQAVVKAKRDQGQLALMFVDLDKFKPVNDRYGHAAGDQLLQAVAHRLRVCVRESDTVARVGGDEFVVLLNTVHHTEDATRVADKILLGLRSSFLLPMGQSVHIACSIGIALYPAHGLDETTLSHHADVAMYAAKAAGRDQYVVYSLALDQPVANPQT